MDSNASLRLIVTVCYISSKKVCAVTDSDDGAGPVAFLQARPLQNTVLPESNASANTYYVWSIFRAAMSACPIAVTV